MRLVSGLRRYVDNCDTFMVRVQPHRGASVLEVAELTSGFVWQGHELRWARSSRPGSWRPQRQR